MDKLVGVTNPERRERLLSAVGELYRLTPERVASHCRRREYVEARTLYSLAAIKIAKATTAQIGQDLNRDPSSIQALLKKPRTRTEKRELDRLVDRVKGMLTGESEKSQNTC